MSPDRGAAAILLVAVVALVLGATGPADHPEHAIEHVEDADLVRPGESGSALWPYTSRSRGVADRTLAVNVVVLGEPAAVRRALTEQTNREWNRSGPDTGAVIDETGIDWRGARGSARYTYVRPSEGAGRWIGSEYQLESGAYLGARYHVRAYAAPDGEWTALQAHREYWDWFRLRHTVTAVGDAGDAVEADLVDRPNATAADRMAHRTTADGRERVLRVVEFALTLLVVGVVGIDLRDRRTFEALRVRASGVALGAAIAALYLGVRAAGLGLEAALPGVDPKLFAAVLYPVLAAGMPTLAWGLSRSHRPAAAFGLTAAGLGTAIAIDFAALGVVPPPRRLAFHRIALLAALGLIAGGGARGGPVGRRALALGLVAWLVGLAAPLVGVV